MSGYRDLLFFVPGVLSVLFMLWVLVKFTQQLAGTAKSARQGEAESRYLYVVPADTQRGRASAQD